MSATKPTTSQIRFTSRYTGEHLLDTYLEAMEKGGRSVPDILDDLFSDDGNLIANVDMRFNTQTLFVEYRHGVFVDPEAGWQPVAKFKFWQNKGEYTPGTAYEIHDIVTHNENWLICTEAHTGTDPIVGLYWDTLFNADYIKSVQADVTSKLNDTETKRAEVEANQQDVATRQTDIITRQADITTKQADITAIQSDVTAKQTDVTTKHGEVDTSRQDVETRQTDIIARQSDITTKQTDITTKHTQVEADRAEVETRQSDIIAIQSDITTKQTDVTTKHSEVQSNTTLTGTYKDEAKTYRDEAKNYADTVTGGIVELGNYDASTNTLPAKPTTSAFWKITTAGTLNGISYGVGDSLIYSLSSDTFYKIDNTEAVTSVNGYQGVVSLTFNDVSAHPNTWTPSWAQVTGKPSTFTPEGHTHTASEITDLSFDTSQLLPLTGGTMSGDIKMTEGNVFGRGIYWGSGYAEGYIRQSTAQGTVEIGTSDSLTIKHSSTNGVAATINTISATFSGIIYANSNKRVFADDYHPNADQLTTARNITLGGDLSGSVSFDGSANVTLTATVSDNTHNHTIANVTGLQTELDGKANNSHNHDAAYYTQAQVDAIVATLQARLDALEAKTAQQSVTGTTTIFSGEVQATDISIGN